MVSVVVPRSDMGDLQCGVIALCAGVATETPALTLPHFPSVHILLVSLYGGVSSSVNTTENVIDIKDEVPLFNYWELELIGFGVYIVNIAVCF